MINRGNFMALYGPDGSGKSTIADGLMKRLSDSGIKTSHFHWRPRVLPPKNKDKIFKYDVTRPDDMPNRSAVASLALYIYFFMDFLVGYIALLKPRLHKGEYVIYERYYYDISVHPRRYRLVSFDWLGRLLSVFLPKPDMIIILHGDSHLIHERKGELSTSEIERQQKVLKNLFGNANNAMFIDVSTMSPDAIVSNILESNDKL